MASSLGTAHCSRVALTLTAPIQRNVMKSPRCISVTLNHVNALTPSAVVLVNANRHGQLPAVLVDPVDSQGRVRAGTWLGDDLGDRTDGTSYTRLRCDKRGRDEGSRLSMLVEKYSVGARRALLAYFSTGADTPVLH